MGCAQEEHHMRTEENESEATVGIAGYYQKLEGSGEEAWPPDSFLTSGTVRA